MSTVVHSFLCVMDSAVEFAPFTPYQQMMTVLKAIPLGVGMTVEDHFYDVHPRTLFLSTMDLTNRGIIVETLSNCVDAFCMQICITNMTNTLQMELDDVLKNPEDANTKGDCCVSHLRTDSQPVLSESTEAMTKAVYYSVSSLPYHLSVFTVQTSFYIVRFIAETVFDSFVDDVSRWCAFLFHPSHPRPYGVLYDPDYYWRRTVYRGKCMLKKIGRTALLCFVNWMLESIGMAFSAILDSSQNLQEWRYRSLWEQYYIFCGACSTKQCYTHILQPQMIDHTQPMMKGAVSNWTHPQRKMQTSQPP